MLSWIRNRWTSLCLLIMALGAFMLFLYGFFPLKYHSGKMAHMDDLPIYIDSMSIDGQSVYESGEHSVVLMIIDSLRYDFVTDEYMPFTAELLKNKSACIYVSLAEPPTVTMPRIKAMMTGSVSTFADVALNFGAPAVRGDSVLRVAAARGRKSIMYGDDTWLRLFPGLWAEYDGTTSFFVTDYTEVDQNVTRHLDKVLTPDENLKPKFDFLVLHYLGLDHIGHLEGARSPKIKTKLLEMDDVIKKIFTAMQKWDRTGVLFIGGDHGMRDAGGHGGATPAEVLVPLVLAKTQGFSCPHPLGPGPTVAQVDVAPSIAWLLNAPPPGDNTGRILPALLPADVRQHLYLLHIFTAQNAKQPSMPTDTESYKQFKRAEKQYAHYLATGQQSAAKIAKEFYEESLTKMAKYLTETTANFDLFALGTACVMLCMIVIAILNVTLFSLQPENDRKVSVGHHHKISNLGMCLAFSVILTIVIALITLACFITETKSKVCSFNPIWSVVLVLIGCSCTMAYFISKKGFEKTKNFQYLKDLNAIDYLLLFGTIFHAWSFFGTSFIEEEHMTWYFFWNTLMLFVLVRNVVEFLMFLGKFFLGATEVQDKKSIHEKMFKKMIMLPRWVLLIALHRYLRTMNQTGDRWLFLPDTADWLNDPENKVFLQAHLVIGTLITLAICLYNLKFTNNTLHMHSVITILSTACILCYRIATDALYTPIPEIKTWDTVIIVNVFWGLVTAQFVFELLTYVGIFKTCCLPTNESTSNKKFVYNKPKAKTEDHCYDAMVEEPWNLDEVKLNLVCSITHLMFNNMMLIIILLMRPHNVIMVPSIYVTCLLTSICVDHTFLDTKFGRKTEAADALSKTLSHLWIGAVFFFYQGNSNSLASVDLGSGYVGLREYCPVRVAARMGIHAYAGPALAGGALFCAISARASSWEQYLNSIWRSANIFAFQRVYALFIYSVIALFFRHHLFVWSVFSPKLLYDFVGAVFTIQALLTIASIVGLAHLTSKLAKTLAYKTKF